MLLTVGLGFVLPLTDRLLCGIQLGVLYPINAEVEVKIYKVDGNESYEYDLERTFGYNGEANISYLILDNILLQGGYRHQRTHSKCDERNLDEWDVFHGITFSAVYLVGL
jgi:hypothetical protein